MILSERSTILFARSTPAVCKATKYWNSIEHSKNKEGEDSIELHLVQWLTWYILTFSQAYIITLLHCYVLHFTVDQAGFPCNTPGSLADLPQTRQTGFPIGQKPFRMAF